MRHAEIIHRVPSPFPFKTPKGVIILDETCSCGALRSEHADTFAYGHGACDRTSCPKFTWIAWVKKEQTK